MPKYYQGRIYPNGLQFPFPLSDEHKKFGYEVAGQHSFVDFQEVIEGVDFKVESRLSEYFENAPSTKVAIPLPISKSLSKVVEGAEEKAKAIINEFYQPLGYLSCNVSSGKMWEYAKKSALLCQQWKIDLLRSLLEYDELINNFFIVDAINDEGEILSEISKL